MAVNVQQEDINKLYTITAEHLRGITDSVTASITANVGALIADNHRNREISKNQERIKEQCSHIEKCDGLATEDIREWLRNTGIAVKNTDGIVNNIHRITRKTTSGQLYRTIERWFQTKGDAAITWDELRKYLQDSFLGSNEEERLRLELSKVKQGTDGILMFNRKFRELADSAYGAIRTNEVEKTIIRNYLMALRDKDLAKRVIIESEAKTLEAAVTYVDKVAMGMEMFETIFQFDEPMDCSAVEVSKKTDNSSELQKKVERQNTKIAKLEAQLEMLKVSGKSRSQPRNGGPRCYNCGREGHVRRDCRQMQAPHQARPSQQWQPNQRQSGQPPRRQMPSNQHLN